MLRLISLAVCIAVAFGDGHTYYGSLVGDFINTDHLVQGTVYFMDDNRIFIKGFHFDGLPPSTYIFVGTTTNPAEVSVLVPHVPGRIEQLGALTDYDLTAYLPDSIAVEDIRVISVWCRTAFASFGHVVVPEGHPIPAEISLGEFPADAQHLVAGSVTIINNKQLRVSNFHYDGTAPDVTFYVGTGPVTTGTMVPDENGSFENFRRYEGETIVVTLPGDLEVFDIEWFSVWCDQFAANFGHVTIENPADLLPPVYVMEDMVFLGVDMGALSELGHDVSGHVYIVDEYTIRIYNLNYDGTAPDTHYYIGWEGTAERGVVDGRGVILEANGVDSNGDPIPLGMLENADVVLRLPDGYNVSQILWVSIWCEQANADFGNVQFPEEFGTLPAPAVADPAMFSGTHDLSSGTVTFINERQVVIENLVYDGLGPDTFFWVGRGTPDTNGAMIPDENGSPNTLPEYTGQTITLTLPEGLTWYDFEYLSLWCRQAVANFGHVNIPSNIFLPPYIDNVNCMTLREGKFNVNWYVMNGYIYVEMQGVLDGPTGYMAFGFSRNPDRSSMAGADAVVGHYLTGEAEVHDLHLTAYAQCVNGQGACSDVSLGGTNDAMLVDARQTNGITVMKYRRALNTGDDNDVVYDPSSPIYIVWAMGRMQPNGLVSKHDFVLTQSTMLMNMGTCAPVVADDEMPVDGWPQEMIVGVQEFTARIGPSGGAMGYRAITGKQPWGISWYINGYIIPKIYMRRGDTFKFKVNGGDNPAQSAAYHPFYLTSSDIGGYVTLNEQEREEMNEVFYAGVNTNVSPPEPTAVGPLCEYRVTPDTEDPEEYETFDEYFDTLDLDCPHTTYGELTFTPDDSTPDIIYYQCYTHRSLGWEIHVVDEYPVIDSATDIRPAFTLVSIFTALSVALAKLLL